MHERPHFDSTSRGIKKVRGEGLLALINVRTKQAQQGGAVRKLARWHPGIHGHVQEDPLLPWLAAIYFFIKKVSAQPRLAFLTLTHLTHLMAAKTAQLSSTPMY
jgi:hypothetical protein